MKTMWITLGILLLAGCANQKDAVQNQPAQTVHPLPIPTNPGTTSPTTTTSTTSTTSTSSTTTTTLAPADPGPLNCFQSYDVILGGTDIFCTGGNLGSSIAELENFGWSTTVITNVTINENTNPQPGNPIVCVTEELHDIPHGQAWTSTMCGSIYNTVTNVLHN